MINCFTYKQIFISATCGPEEKVSGTISHRKTLRAHTGQNLRTPVFVSCLRIPVSYSFVPFISYLHTGIEKVHRAPLEVDRATGFKSAPCIPKIVDGANGIKKVHRAPLVVDSARCTVHPQKVDGATALKKCTVHPW